VPVQTATRAIAAVSAAAFLILLLSGCDAERYPDDLEYPNRVDVLMTPTLIASLNTNAPKAIDPPGLLPYMFESLPADERKKALDPRRLPNDVRGQLGRVLNELFGTPAKPKAALPTDAAAALQLDDETLAKGSGVYRTHCLHCHGLAGDGRGPTGPWVNPHPRDYRQGVFKFTSSSLDAGTRKARREDLARTVREGVEGTSMPSFRLLSGDELDAVVSYVIHLSLRGEVEFLTLLNLLSDESADRSADGVKSYASEDVLPILVKRWIDTQSKDNVIQLSPYASMTAEQVKESAKRGMALFFKQGEAGCIGCHIRFGRQDSYSYDDWGTIIRRANLTSGVYRGGRRPADLYYRIHSGINGSGMTAFGKTLSGEQVWDLVNFLQALPHPAMRKDLVGDID
jgi:mono/diheme cytochrome c family protein